MSSLLTSLQAAIHAVPEPVWLAFYGAWLLLAWGYLVVQRRGAEATLAWGLAATFLPFISAVIYLVFGPRRLVRKRFRRSAAKDAVRDLLPDTACELPPSLAGRHWLSALARVATAAGNNAPHPAEAVRVFLGGDETYAAIESAIRGARRQIHLEYYIWEPDTVGTRWRELLTERARAGLTVRVLVDALGSQRAGPAFWKPLVAAGGEVRYFNPVRWAALNPSLINFRTHRKIAVIDGHLAYTGGINISAGSSAASSGSAAWRDTHLEVRGAPALDLQTVFLEDWLYACEHRRDQKREIKAQIDVAEWFPEPDPASPSPAPTSRALPIPPSAPWVQIIDSGPDEPLADIHRFLFTAITSARRRVWITTPYFVPDEALVAALSTARARGLDVRLLLPRAGDSLLVTAAAYTYAQEVMEQGVAVYEYLPRMVHAKTMVVDDELTLVGTANLDNRSFRLNFEVLAAIYDADIASQMARAFEADLADARPLPRADARERLHQRLLAGLARLASPIL